MKLLKLTKTESRHDMWGGAKQTSPHAPLQVLPSGKLNDMIPELLPVYSESYANSCNRLP